MSDILSANDPKLWDYVPEGIDPSADMVGRKFGPAPDGVYNLKLILRQPTENLPLNPYVKVGEKPSLVAVFRVVLTDSDGNFKGYANDYYSSTAKVKGQSTSPLHFILKQNGVTVAADASFGTLKDALVRLSEQRGDEGLLVRGYVRWVRNVKLADDSYEKIKGQAKVSEFNIAESIALINEQDWDDQKKAEEIADMTNNPFQYYDQTSGEKKEVRVEVASLQV